MSVSCWPAPSSALEQQHGHSADVEVDEVLGLVGDVGACREGGQGEGRQRQRREGAGGWDGACPRLPNWRRPPPPRPLARPSQLSAAPRAPTKVPAHDAVPCRVVLHVKLLLDVGRHVLLYRVLLQRLQRGGGQRRQSVVDRGRGVDWRGAEAIGQRDLPAPPCSPRPAACPRTYRCSSPPACAPSTWLRRV